MGIAIGDSDHAPLRCLSDGRGSDVTIDGLGEVFLGAKPRHPFIVIEGAVAAHNHGTDNDMDQNMGI